MALSHGCVRLNINNAKWIYDNIPAGSTVCVYHQSPGPVNGNQESAVGRFFANVVIKKAKSLKIFHLFIICL